MNSLINDVEELLPNEEFNDTGLQYMYELNTVLEKRRSSSKMHPAIDTAEHRATLRQEDILEMVDFTNTSNLASESSNVETFQGREVPPGMEIIPPGMEDENEKMALDEATEHALEAIADLENNTNSHHRNNDDDDGDDGDEDGEYFKAKERAASRIWKAL